MNPRLIGLQGLGGGARAIALQGLISVGTTPPVTPPVAPIPKPGGGQRGYSPGIPIYKNYRTAPDRHEIPIVLMDGDDEEAVILTILMEIAKDGFL